MVTSRRVVRASPSFFADLDTQLPQERTVDGVPSAHDFLTFDLFDCLDTFALRFDDLPRLEPGRADVRLLVTSGVAVSRFAIVGRLEPDQTISLIALETDRTW